MVAISFAAGTAIGFEATAWDWDGMGIRRSAEALKRLPDAIEAARRILGLDPFPPQIATAQCLLNGQIVELDTGEGKTLAGAIGAALHAQSGTRVWVATANDYLAGRDADGMRPFHAALNLTTGAVADGMSQPDRRRAYQCDVVYGTLREFGFDYLRSRLAERLPAAIAARKSALFGIDPFQNALIVDEADSLLIDEARTPLIISEPGERGRNDEGALRWCAEHAAAFVEGVDYRHQEPDRVVALTEVGRSRLLGLAAPPLAAHATLDELMLAMERAIMVNDRYLRDRDYVVADGKLLIVDEFTGRTSEGRTWSEGIHQSLEAREGLAMTPRNRTAAQVTVQDFVGRFRILAGMTGTALESAREFRAVYGTRTIRIPPMRPCRRIEMPPEIHARDREKWSAVADDAARVRAQGRPVLIGTRTVEASEVLAAEFDRAGIPHVVLSARHPDREAEVIACAGEVGRVTIATNMAGRGTDIRIPEAVRAAGGLHVIGTERHASARIDRQLAGRCARQGDPGSCRWHLSHEDEILALAAGDVRAEPPVTPGRPLRDVDFRKAQRRVERRYERDRLILRLMNADIQKQYELLGLDPIVDRVE